MLSVTNCFPTTNYLNRCEHLRLLEYIPNEKIVTEAGMTRAVGRGFKSELSLWIIESYN